MKSSIRAVAVIALIGASGAWAVAKGGKLYIKSKDTKVLKEAKAGAATAATAQPGDEVIWNGPAADKQFHEVMYKGKKGFVLMANLSPSAPVAEIDASSGKPMSAQSFASSGAATKGLTPAGVKYAKASGQGEADAAADIIYVEEHNKAKATPALVAAKAKELGGGK